MAPEVGGGLFVPEGNHRVDPCCPSGRDDGRRGGDDEHGQDDDGEYPGVPRFDSEQELRHEPRQRSGQPEADRHSEADRCESLRQNQPPKLSHRQ